ncbi:MAG: OsmC family protein [Zestosphaera sp.]
MKVESKDMIIKASGTRVSPTKMIVKCGDYEVITDKLGGEAPSPIEYVLVALAGCINIVGTLVARELGISIEDIRINVEGVFDPAKFAKGTGERAGYKDIRVEVLVKSDADAETLKKWLKLVEDRCPVGDNLVNMTPVKSEVRKI